VYLEDFVASLESGPIAPSDSVKPKGDTRRRKQDDRRRRPTTWWNRFQHRRAAARRGSEIPNTYVDVYQRRDLAILIAIFTINLADAFFTLHWIGRGGAEGNPVMAWVLGFGQAPFLALKCMAVGAWLLVLVIHKNFTLARLGLFGLLLFYSLLLGYHIFLYLFADPIPLPNV